MRTDILTCGMCEKSIDGTVYVRIESKYIHKRCFVRGLLAERDLLERDLAAARASEKAMGERVAKLEEARRELLKHMSNETMRLGKALEIARQMANCIYNAKQTNWDRAKVALVELLPLFDAALAPPAEAQPQATGTTIQFRRDFCPVCDREISNTELAAVIATHRRWNHEIDCQSRKKHS